MRFLIFLILFVNLINGSMLKDVEFYNIALEKAKKQNKKVLMFMYSDYCFWCKTGACGQKK